MLHGCATIAADEGGPVEMMSADSGFMFDADLPGELASHLRTLIRDAELRTRVADRARRHARTFDVRDYVGRIEDRYRTLFDATR
jgi:glycosyltransferase involved in cell wall biosynthesis